MRPVLLEMNGFACFREPAKVDFTDADFFALVGPTGSGKSTVIDAMTFALYGSVPRWGRKGMVSLALAPTVVRGTVKLVFDVEGQRYVVARELRRMGGQVNQRAASLERLADAAGLASPGDQTEPLAGSLAEVTEKVERLLGLSYEDFCQCVVLPQGQFASFLHAKPSERQEILLRLLGAEHYKQMMMRANQRAGNAAQRAHVHAEALLAFADATQEAEAASRAAEGRLAALKNRTDDAIPRIHLAQQALAGARARLDQLDSERSTLAAVQIPDGIAILDESLTAARQALSAARTAEDLAEVADRGARAALASGPRRAPLERVRDQRAEHAREAGRLPREQADLSERSAASAAAAARESRSASALEEARSRLGDAARRHEDAESRVRQLTDEGAALAAVTVPPDAEQAGERHHAAAAAVREASAALQAAERADSDARAACGAAPASGPLQQALRDLSDLGRIRADLVAAQGDLDRARIRTADAESALGAADAARQRAQADLDQARRANVIADLRPHLAPGHACPVCEQPVRSLPAPLHAPAIGQAQARLDEAEATLSAARAEAGAAVSAHDTAAARAESLSAQQARAAASLAAALDGALAAASMTSLAGVVKILASPAAPAGAAGAASDELTSQVDAAVAEVHAAVSERRGLDEAADAAAAAVQSARTAARSAESRLEQAEAGIATARSAFNAARDPLVMLGAPAADDAPIATAWAGLARWAAAEAEARGAALASARETAGAAAADLAAIRAEFAESEAAVATAHAEAIAAARAEQEAQTLVTELTSRIESLRRALESAPGEHEVAEQLALVTSLENAAAQCDASLLAARSERASAEHQLTDLEQAESAARTRLLDARDPLVGLGAPAVDPGQNGLLASWTDLATWAAREAVARAQAIAAAAAAVTDGEGTLSRLTGQLGTDLASAGIDLAPDSVAAGASAAVAEALERARAATARIVERRGQVAELTARRDAELGEHRVARMLGDLLRSDRFPRWLVTAAVDVLVAEASDILAGLSNRQYDLTHDNGDFYIIDHTDADSRRSVRTLSGGETFQASLALALALSSQMTALAAAGAARLDSIFLDEGFGTLDTATLDVVATTLENLAQGQRMVGIITHVTDLAARVPVRYEVSRDARTSTVVREGFVSSDAA